MLLSRVADSLYWISRYLERAEHTARLIDVRLDLGLDRRRGDDAWDFERLYAALRLQPPADVDELGPASLVDALMFDTGEPRLGRCHASPRRARTRARCAKRSAPTCGSRSTPCSCESSRRSAKARGRRARITCRARSSKASISSRASPTRRWATAKDGSTCRSAASSSGPARRRRSSICTVTHRGGSCRASHDRVGRAAAVVLGARGVLPLLHRRPAAASGSPSSCCLNVEFPRSVRFAAARVGSSLRTIAQLTGRGAGGRAERLAGRLHASLDYGQVDEILDEDPHAYLEGISAPLRADPRGGLPELRHVSDRIGAAGLTPMYYTIRHVTRFTYESPITESVMEARMQPRSDGPQRCVRFGLSTTPSSRVRMYQDHEGNIVHHFNIPGRHTRLIVTAEALVECAPWPSCPIAWSADAWQRIDAADRVRRVLGAAASTARSRVRRRVWTRWPQEIGFERGDDPLATVRRTDVRDLRPIRIQPRSDPRRFADRRGARDAPRRLPGLRAHHDCARPAAGRAVPLRQRLPLSADRSRGAGRPRRDARLGRGAAARSGVGRVRSDQQSGRRRRATSASRSAATTRTCRRRAASSKG